jgi:hypothetical protein
MALAAQGIEPGVRAGKYLVEEVAALYLAARKIAHRV